MTRKQAILASYAMLQKTAEAFDNNGHDCKEIFALVNNEKMTIGLARLLLQASWRNYRANNAFHPCFRDAAILILYQHYRRQKPKQKTKAKK